MFAVLHSANSKVGDVAVTYAPIEQTCPTDCSLRNNGCYAQGGNVVLHVRRLERTFAGLNGDTVAALEGAEIADLATKAPAGHALRIHVSGDATSDFRAQRLAKGAAAWNGPVWSYTHAWSTVARESWGRVSILASCETVHGALDALRRGYAASLVVSEHPLDGRAFRTEEGLKVIPCPSQTRDVKCTDCRLCWNDVDLVRQGAAISFATHGAGANKAKRMLSVLKS